MPKPSFVVPVADLEQGPKTVSWVLRMDWLKRALEGSEATPVRDGEVAVELSLNGREVIVRGRAAAELTMPCARTLAPVPITVSPEIFLLLIPEVAPEPPKPRSPQSHTRKAERRIHHRESTRGRRHQTGSLAGWPSDPTLANDQVARDTYDGDRIVLDDFVREFILLELPMVPIRSDLRLGEDAGIREALSAATEPSNPPVDSRLAPLAEIASRLRKSKE